MGQRCRLPSKEHGQKKRPNRVKTCRPSKKRIKSRINGVRAKKTGNRRRKAEKWSPAQEEESFRTKL